MTRIKLCGLMRREDIEVANELQPEFVGFVFAEKSRRKISVEQAADLKKKLRKEISAVGVFVKEKTENIAKIAERGIIDVIQLHGGEDENYFLQLRKLTSKPIIKAFKIRAAEDLKVAENCSAEFILLDSGAGTGNIFDWQVLKNFPREYFLAGGLTAENVSDAINFLHPFGVDVSSGIESSGVKDEKKMRGFVDAVRRKNYETLQTLSN